MKNFLIRGISYILALVAVVGGGLALVFVFIGLAIGTLLMSLFMLPLLFWAWLLSTSGVDLESVFNKPKTTELDKPTGSMVNDIFEEK